MLSENSKYKTYFAIFLATTFASTSLFGERRVISELIKADPISVENFIDQSIVKESSAIKTVTANSTENNSQYPKVSIKTVIYIPPLSFSNLLSKLEVSNANIEVAKEAVKKVTEEKIVGPTLSIATEFTDFTDTFTKPIGPQNASIALNDSTEEELPQQESQEEIIYTNTNEGLYFRQSEELKYQNVTLQIMDDRSQPENKIIYPVGGARVRIVGTDFSGSTQSRKIELPNLPSNSRFLLEIESITGDFRPTIFELSTYTKNKKENVSIFVLRQHLFSIYEQIAKISQNSFNGSLCGKIYDKKETKNLLSGYQVVLDSQSNGPYYFNRFGIFDPVQRQTEQDGRFCFFNVEPGPITISFFQNEEHVLSIPLAMFAGKHLEENFYLEEKTSIATNLAMFPTAPEQLGSDFEEANSFSKVDMIDLVPLGYQDGMIYESDGYVVLDDGISFHNGRAEAISRAPEFEPAIFNFEETENFTTKVVPLIPRGFIEDMCIKGEIPFDPVLGSIVATHANDEANLNRAINFKLIGVDGKTIFKPWYYSSEPVTKAIFFNLEPGKYTLITETGDGYWLSSRTVVVYNETISYLDTGARLVTKEKVEE